MIISTALKLEHDCLSIKFFSLTLKITKFSTKYRLDYAFLHLKNVKSIKHSVGEPILMQKQLREKIIQICNEKIAKKGSNVGLSFYAFFANKNDNPELLMQAAEWWIKTHQLDHFEKAIKIKQLIETEK